MKDLAGSGRGPMDTRLRSGPVKPELAKRTTSERAAASGEGLGGLMDGYGFPLHARAECGGTSTR